MADNNHIYNVEKWIGYNEILNPIICQTVHAVCNGRQFRSIPSIALTMAMNLMSDDAHIGHLNKEQTRICNMLYLIKEYVRSADMSNEWLEAMLKDFDVSFEHYKSHYKDPLDYDSGKNQKFVENINSALNSALKFIEAIRKTT